MKIIVQSICIILIMNFVACNSTQSLQEYYVDKSENPNFLAVDLPASLLNVEKVDLNKKQSETLRALNKLNVLAFKKTEANAKDYQVEKLNIKAILKNSMFNELFKLNTGYGSATVSYVGNDDAIDEVVIYGDNEEKGFIVVRMLGKNMNPVNIAKFLQTLQKSDFNGERIGKLKDFFKA